MRAMILAALMLATPAGAQEMPTLPTDGHPFASLPVEGGLIVTVSSNGRPGSRTGLRVFAVLRPPRFNSSACSPWTQRR